MSHGQRRAGVLPRTVGFLPDELARVFEAQALDGSVYSRVKECGRPVVQEDQPLGGQLHTGHCQAFDQVSYPVGRLTYPGQTGADLPRWRGAPLGVQDQALDRAVSLLGEQIPPVHHAHLGLSRHHVDAAPLAGRLGVQGRRERADLAHGALLLVHPAGKFQSLRVGRAAGLGDLCEVGRAEVRKGRAGTQVKPVLAVGFDVIADLPVGALDARVPLQLAGEDGRIQKPAVTGVPNPLRGDFTGLKTAVLLHLHRPLDTHQISDEVRLIDHPFGLGARGPWPVFTRRRIGRGIRRLTIPGVTASP